MKKIRFILITLLTVLVFEYAYAQVDTLHYLPPLYYTGESNSDFQDQYIILSTFETTPFSVRIRTRDGSYDNTVLVSQANPVQINMGLRFAAVGLIGPTQKNTVLNDEGVIISGPKPFFVNQTHYSNLQATIITSKGTVGLGKEFYAGFMASRMEANNNVNKRRSHFVSFIAAENNTFVTVSNSRVRWDGKSTNTFTIVLQAGQSYVITKDFYNSGLNNTTINDLNGTKITSNKPIAVTSGSWTSAWNTGLRDIGLDQIVPVDIVGNEYIVQRGNGSDLVERVIVVSTGGTNRIYLNGSSSAYATLSGEGDYVIIPEGEYSSRNTMYIETDNPVYVYQSLAGSNSDATTGMQFIPRLSCNVSKKVQISYADFLGNPAIKLITQTGSTVTINGVTIGGGQTVPGNNNWEAYSVNQATLSGCNPGPNWNFTIQSTGALNASLTIESSAIGAGGYYSGFGTVPEISYNPVIAQQGFCAGNAELTASGYSNYVWYKDGAEIPGETSSAYQPTSPGRYKVVGVTTCAGQPSYTYPSGEVLILPCMSFNPDSIAITEGDIAHPNAVFNIQLSHSWDEDDITFQYTTVQGTAQQGVDYTNVSGTATIASGDLTTSVSVPILNDLLAEDDEFFRLKLSHPVNTVFEQDSGSAYIIDDADPKPTLALATSKTVAENAGLVQFAVTLSIPSGQTVSANYSISNGTATAGSDFSAASYSGTVTFLPGETSKNIGITIIDDPIDEPGANENLTITLSGIVNALSGNLSSTCSITDNDATPILTVSPVSVAEGTNVVLHGTLDHGSSRNIIFRNYTFSISATSPADYAQLVSVRDTIYAGNTSFQVTIPTVDDAIMEGSETFGYALVNLQNATFANASTSDSITVTLLDNEGLPQISIADVLVTEGNIAKVPVQISHPSSTAITFEYNTLNQSATGGSDFNAVSPPQVFTVAANALYDTISITTLEDTDEEGNETFRVELHNSSANSIFSDSIAVVTIVDNDETPVANDDGYTVNEDASFTDNLLTNDAGLGDTPISIVNHTNPLHGSVSINASTGEIQYIPAANYHGGDSLQYTIEDADGDQSSAWVRITVNSVNDVPVAVNDNFTIDENQQLDTTIINNDSGLGDGYTIAVITTVSHGSLTMGSNGTFSYTPVLQYFGTDAFVYEITDGNGEKRTATATITVNYTNDFDPVALNDTVSTPEDTPVNISVLANDSDADGNSTIDIASVLIESGPSHGSISVNPLTGVVAYTPTTNYQGSDLIEYSFFDNGSRQSNIGQIIITVTANNDVPVAMCNDTIDAFLNNSGAFALTTALVNNGSYDPDGDPLTYILSKSAFTCADLGYTTITMTVRDPLLAQAQCSSVIDLGDTIRPVVYSAPTDTVIYVSSGCGVVVNYNLPQFQDNCSGIIPGTLTAGFSSGSTFSIDTTVISYSYTDPSGNGPVEATFNVVVRDTIAPAVACTDQYLFANSGTSYAITTTSFDPTVTENCSYTLTHDVGAGGSSLNGLTLPSGASIIQWTATDAVGNVRNCEQHIYVYDSLKMNLAHSDDNDTLCENEPVVFTANTTGGMGSLTYTFYIDNNPVMVGVSGNQFTTSSLADGQEVKAIVTDSQGNSVESDTYVFAVFRLPVTGPVHKPNDL